MAFFLASKKRQYFSIAALAFSSLFLQACSSDAKEASNKTQVEITDNSGSHTVIQKPENLVVLDTRTLDALTLFDYPVAGAPQTSAAYPTYMASYLDQDHFNAGSFFEPDYERINQAKPELIIAGGRSADAIPELNKIAQTIDLSIPFGDTVPAIDRQMTALGKILGQEAKAATLLTDFHQRMNDVEKQGEKAGTALVVMINGGRLSAYGAGSRFGFIYDELGFKPAVDLENKGKHGNPMSFELILKTNPDWLFVFSRDQAIGTEGAQTAQQIMNNPLIQETKAQANDQVIYLDAGAMYVAGGYNAYMQLMDQVESALKKDA